MAEYPHTWVVVADASRARIFAWTAPSAPLEEIADPLNPEGRLKSSALTSDRPSVAADAQGRRSGHPMQASHTAHEKSVIAFAQQISGTLSAGLDAKSYQQLVLFAPPEFLGQLRRQLDRRVELVVVESTALDLTSETSEAIKARLPRLTGLT